MGSPKSVILKKERTVGVVRKGSSPGVWMIQGVQVQVRMYLLHVPLTLSWHWLSLVFTTFTHC